MRGQATIIPLGWYTSNMYAQMTGILDAGELAI